MKNKRDGGFSAREKAVTQNLGFQQNGARAKRGKDNSHNRDINSKTVFDNAVLCAQFLRDNFNIPMLKNVQPEDIEDVSERYYPYLGTEFSADSVKRVRILGINREKSEYTAEPPFLVSLIDHKSLVDYDVSMQLLRYMVCIWTEYKREMEGRQEWTADTRLCQRIRDSAVYAEWIPDFQYHVVRLHDYSDQELLERRDAMSLIMLINKIQSAADLEHFIQIPAEELDRIVKDSPKQVVEILVSVMESLLIKIDVSDAEREECVQKIREGNMGYLFENMEKISIQKERRKTEKAEKKARTAEEELERERQRARDAAKEAEEKLQFAEEKLRLAEEKLRQLQERTEGPEI